jgi:hypothetical protein
MKKHKRKYFDSSTLDILTQASKEIVAIRNRVHQLTTVDLLDTDAISSSFLYEIITQYDPEYNVNFGRNNEDAKSKGILIENKTTRVLGNLTKTGKLRKGAGEDASFQFHADGDLEHPRYIFAAKNKDDLAIIRLYDISSTANCKLILDHLLAMREEWHERCRIDPKHKKRDVIVLPEKFILENLNLTTKETINNCVILRD